MKEQEIKIGFEDLKKLKIEDIIKIEEELRR